MLPLLKRVQPIKKATKNLEILNAFKLDHKEPRTEGGLTPCDTSKRASFGTISEQKIMKEIIEETERSEKDEKRENNCISDETLAVSSLLLSMNMPDEVIPEKVLPEKRIFTRQSLSLVQPTSSLLSPRGILKASLSDKDMTFRRELSVIFSNYAPTSPKPPPRPGMMSKEPSVRGFRKNTIVEISPEEILEKIELEKIEKEIQQNTLLRSLLDRDMDKFPCFLSIKHGENRDIVATVMAIDSTFHLIIKLPLTLSTFALIDNEAATEFIENIVPKLYLEIPHNYNSMIRPKLKMTV
jgi:hypothetical protein